MPTRPWKEIEAGMTPDQVARSDAQAEALRVGVLINRLRKSRGLTQVDLANKLGVTQQAVSKMEWGEEIQLSTLRRVLAALGGELYVHTDQQQIPLLDATAGPAGAAESGAP